jgi:hypothetical protein
MLRIGALVVGVLVGGATIIAFGTGDERTNDPGSGGTRAVGAEPAGHPKESVAPTPEGGSVSSDPNLVLAWSPGGLPAQTERTVESLAGVKRATTVIAQLEWIEVTKTGSGKTLDDPGDGLAIPFEVAAVEAREYAHFVDVEDREALLSLQSGRMLLAETSAGLRGGGRGIDITTESARRSVSGVVSDATANGYEGLVAGPPPASWSDSYRFVLVEVEDPSVIGRVKETITDLAGGAPLQIRKGGENPFLRYGDAVLPQMLVKEAFGEFAARSPGDGSIEIDPAWRKSHIVKTSLPLVGQVTCHRKLLRPLDAALRELRAAGLDHLIHRGQFAGCFSPRFISHDPEGNLSHHSWGIAVDINAAENPFGHPPRMDERIVSAFGKWGFTWGGRWILPDGMHFEWIEPKTR